MKVAFFRADASQEIGTGHVMRCLTLADALRARSWECHFVCRDHAGNLLDIIRERGHVGHLLPPPSGDLASDALASDTQQPVHARWLGVDWRTDAEQTRAAIGSVRVEWMIVDHYGIDARWHRALSGACRRIMVIDDLADRDYACDLLLDQNVLAGAGEYYVGRVPPGCVILPGPRFLLLRRGFSDLASRIEKRTGHVRRGLIAFAGADSDDFTSAAVEALATAACPGARVDVLIGRHHPARARIETACAAHGFELHVQVADPAPLMASSDMAIAACGFISYELAAMGVPAVLVPVSDIQQRVAQRLAELGVAAVLDTADVPDRRDAFRSTWLTLARNEAARTAMSAAGMHLIDGQGTARVVEHMLAMAGGDAP